MLKSCMLVMVVCVACTAKVKRVDVGKPVVVEVVDTSAVVSVVDSVSVTMADGDGLVDKSLSIQDCLSFFNENGYELIPEGRRLRYGWMNVPDALFKPVAFEAFGKGMVKREIIEVNWKVDSIQVVVVKGKRADFKFVLFTYGDSILRANDEKLMRAHSKYVFHAHSRIKHPNYYFSFGRQCFYFQTRASMFSDEVKSVMQIMERKLRASIE